MTFGMRQPTERHAGLASLKAVVILGSKRYERDLDPSWSHFYNYQMFPPRSNDEALETWASRISALEVKGADLKEKEMGKPSKKKKKVKKGQPRQKPAQAGNPPQAPNGDSGEGAEPKQE